MRAVLFFLLGAVTALVGAIAWMPRPAWIELLDHVRGFSSEVATPHDWFNEHNSRFAFGQDIGAAVMELTLKEGQYDEIVNTPRLDFADGRPFFSLKSEDIHNICLKYYNDRGLWEASNASYDIIVNAAAAGRLNAAFDSVITGDAGIPITVSAPPVGEASVLYINSKFRKPLEARGGGYVFSIGTGDPYMEDGIALLKRLNGGAPIEDCEYGAPPHAE